MTMMHILRAALLALCGLALSVPATAQTIMAPAPVTDTRLSTASTTLRHVGNRTGIANQKSGSNTRAGFRTWQFNYVAGYPRVCFYNGYVGSATSGVETGTGGVMTLTLYVEVNGVATSWKWGGAASGTIANNGWGCSDPSPVLVPAYTKYRICGDMQIAAGGTIPTSGWSNAADSANGDEYQVGTTSDYCATGTVLAKTPAQQIFPTLVLAESDRTVWGAVGDSIVAGVNYTQTQPSGGRGILAALAEFGPSLNFGVPGDRATWYASNSTIRRAMMAAGGVTSVIDELGFNDLNNSRTSAQLLADRATIRGFFTGLSVYESTITPASTSTDLFKTAANQTINNSTVNTQRTTYNDALRAGVTGVAGVLEFASAVETSTASETGPVINGGVYVPICMYNGDGVHPLEQCERQKIFPVVRALLSTRR